MEPSFSLAVLVAVFGSVLLAGFVTGLTGFGYAIVGTSLLATVFAPSTAIVVMIIPMLAANVTLARELEGEGLRSCVRRFWPYVSAAIVGTLVGMALLTRLPTGPLTLFLGLFTLGYVVFSQNRVAIPGLTPFERTCFVEHPVAKVGLGLASGFVFGASNVGVQVVAYLDSLSLDRSTFVGVLAMIFLGISTVRVGAAATLGLYESTGVVVLSTLATVPGLVGVIGGRRMRPHVSRRVQTIGTFVLLTVIGLRLTASGAGLL